MKTQNKIVAVFLALTALVLLAGGCHPSSLFGSRDRAPFPAPAQLAPETKDQDPPPLRPGLTIKVIVTVSGRKEVEELSKRVSPSGVIVLPLVGLVKVSGLTVEQLAAVLTERYSEYLQNPFVDVDYVVDRDEKTLSPWGFVTVLGRVKEPGRINIPPTRDLSLSMAVQLAGGLDTSAKLTGIRITRHTDGKTKYLDVDLHSVGAEGKTEGDLQLEAGDVVYVPQRVF